MSEEEEQNNKQDEQQLDAESFREQIKKEVLQQIQEENQSETKKRQREREEEEQAHKQYVDKMKNSEEPWVEVLGTSHTSQGVKVELEWNDAFVEYLRQNGVSGTDDEQVVQRWITLLLRDMADQMEGNQDSTYE